MLTQWNRCIVALLLLVYTSQSIAALLLPCPMDAAVETDASVPAAQSMHHGMGHDMDGMAPDYPMAGHSKAHDVMSIDSVPTPAQPTDGPDKFDCCDAMGHCLMGSCMIHGASNDFVQALEESASKAAYSNHLKSPSHLTSVRFRPPIFA